VSTKAKIASLLLLTGALISSGRAGAGSRRVNEKTYDESAQRQIVPLKIYRDFLLVAKGQFGTALEDQNFIIDTGTAPSIINASLVARLGLATVPSPSRAMGKTIPGQALTFPEIELGPICAVSLHVQVQDLSRIERDLGIPIAAIIGLDVLSKYSFRLDYDKREMEFGSVSHTGIPVHFDPRTGIAVAEVRVEGKETRFLLDTGTDRVVLFGGNFPDAGWLNLQNTSQTAANQVSQEVDLQVFSAADIIIGGQRFSDERAYLVPGSTDSLFDGLLGVRALGFRDLSYDQARETFYLQK
jgi:predicted aspartyl protease